MLRVILGLLVGATLGSHAGVALTRWPDGRSVLRPIRSTCGACGTELTILELVPLASWLALRGRCLHCSVPIDRRLPAIEVACAALGGLVAWKLVPPVHAAVAIVVGSAVVLATMTDLERRIIPDRLTIPLAVLIVPIVALDALVSAALVDRSGASSFGVPSPASLAAIVLVPVALMAVNALSVRTIGSRAIGGGDIKLLVGLTAATLLLPGGLRVFWATVAFVGGGVVVAGLLCGRLRPGDRIPFAPLLLVAYLAALVLPDASLATGWRS